MATSRYRRCPLVSLIVSRFISYTLLNRAILFGGQHLVTAQKALDAS
jgi:hypothetical protein